MFNAIEKDLVPLFVKQTYVRGLKEISTLNFEIFNIEPTYDYFFYYFSVLRDVTGPTTTIPSFSSS
jgi:ABC-type amino acid transport system permease subunit